MNYIQDDPFCIQVELTEGCNIQVPRADKENGKGLCQFCGLNGIRENHGDYKFMSIETAKILAGQIKDSDWNVRIEFAMHGEPTMNKSAEEIVKIFRTALPNHQLMMTSNGGGLIKVERIAELFKSGLNILALDNYEGANLVPKILDRLEILATQSGKNYVDIEGVKIDYYEYPEDPEGNPHRRYPKNTRFVSIIKDISKSDKGTHANLVNHAGCGAPTNNNKDGKRCVSPFRETSVRWDGSIAGCCMDYRGIYKCGNIHNTPISEIWQNEQYAALRKFLYNGKREMEPCKGCDFTGYRVGLLPDKLGKRTLLEPDEHDYEVYRAAIAGNSYSKIVWREWEKK